MTSEISQHYEGLLAPNYTWMFGVPFEVKVSEQMALLKHLLDVKPPCSGRAIDLGSGPGFQAIALADLGFAPVLALDTSATFLRELEQHRSQRDITPTLADMRYMRHRAGPGDVRVITCMGDTLTHLPGLSSVRKLFKDAYDVLEPGGSIVLTFRDLTNELHGLDRFIEVRTDAHRIMTCFLEFSAETVTVHDLIHLRDNDGWHLLKGSYEKLRISADVVTGALSEAGLEVVVNQSAGSLKSIVARR